MNLKAPSLIFKELIKYKRANKIKSRLRFINIASRAAFRGEQEDYISYACSKGGMISLTKTMSRSFGETDNIVAISIAPGFVRTEMAQSFIDKHGEDVVKQGLLLTGYRAKGYITISITNSFWTYGSFYRIYNRCKRWKFFKINILFYLSVNIQLLYL